MLEHVLPLQPGTHQGYGASWPGFMPGGHVSNAAVYHVAYMQARQQCYTPAYILSPHRAIYLI
jgi:hypothetical protein